MAPFHVLRESPSTSRECHDVIEKPLGIGAKELLKVSGY